MSLNDVYPPAVISLPGQTEMETGSHVTLHCLLHTHDQCGRSVEDAGIRLSWVDKTGSELKNSTDSQIGSPSMCNTTLTEHLAAKNPARARRTWACQLTRGGNVEAFAIHTLRADG